MKNLFFITILLMGVLSMNAQIAVTSNCIGGTYFKIADLDGRPAYHNALFNIFIRWSTADNHWRIGEASLNQPPIYVNYFNSLEPPCSATQEWTEGTGSCGAITVVNGGSACGTTVLPTTQYVNKAASGANDGTSWTNAYIDLQDAINAANAGDEIWVAAGTYKPTVEYDADGMGADVRKRTFYINEDGIKIYGGFAGTETMLSQRNHETNVTTLSGDFNDDDVVTGAGATLYFSNNFDNAYHVLFIDGATNTITNATVIDGFTIKGGNAWNGISNNPLIIYGGGMLNNGGNGGTSSPTVSNCDFLNNDSGSGGGMCNYGENGTSSPTISNCDFSNNDGNTGGGMFNDGENGTSSPTISNCDFSNNDGNSGGAIFNDGENGTSSPTISNCDFSNNYATAGGVIYNNGRNGTSSPTISDCSFSSNGANHAGVMYNNGVESGNSSPDISNCDFVNNDAIIAGAIIFFGKSTGESLKSTIVNCLFNNNGSEHFFYDDAAANEQPHFINCTFTGATTRVIRQIMNTGQTPVDFTNCIFWNNNGDITSHQNTSVNINHSLIEEVGFTGGTNNIINQDPVFTDAANEDFSLHFCSPALNVGDNTANTSTVDLAGNMRVASSTIDLGAYEYQGSLICPSISVATTTASVTEQNTNKLIYEFTRQDGDLTQSLEINFQISTNSTAATTDYTVTEMGTGNVDFDGMTQKGTITFPANQTTVQLEIMPTADNTVEDGETVIVQLIAAP